MYFLIMEYSREFDTLQTRHLFFQPHLSVPTPATDTSSLFFDLTCLSHTPLETSAKHKQKIKKLPSPYKQGRELTRVATLVDTPKLSISTLNRITAG